MSTNEIARQAVANVAEWLPIVCLFLIGLFCAYCITKMFFTCQCGKWFWQRHDK